MEVTAKVNGKIYKDDVHPSLSLLKWLRKLGFLSLKQGCDTGMCGICTVWVDEKPVLSCSTLAVRVSGASVTTIEGIGEEAEKLGSLIADEGADQCGYCTPGLIMAVVAMKKEIPNPSYDQIYSYLNGNLCRCTGYIGHMRAIKKYLKLK